MQGMRLANETARVESTLKCVMTMLEDADPMMPSQKNLIKKAAAELEHAIKMVWDINASAVRDVNEYFDQRVKEQNG